MKAAWLEFEAALAPILRDLHREHPDLLRVRPEVDDPDLSAWVIDQEGDGTGTGILLQEGWTLPAAAVCELADTVQEAAQEAVWAKTGSGTWPGCPRHPNGHPLEPGLHLMTAVWICYPDNVIIAEIGALGIARSVADPSQAGTARRRN